MMIQEVILNLQKEKQKNVPSRFPCRAIMVRNISQYCALLSELKKISDIRFVQTDELFTNADVMPKYENLKNVKYRNQWIVLTGVSEYLRLFSKSEAADRRFATLWSYQAPSDSTGRIIIPLWGCETQWFDNSLNLMRDLRQQDFYYNCLDSCEEDQSMKLWVFSEKFEKYITKLQTTYGDLKIGLQDWFDYWIEPLPGKEDFVLLTQRYNRVNSTNGNISIHVISNTLELIHENLKDSSVLTQENCTDEMQGILLEYALRGEDLNTALLDILNMSVFSGPDVMGKWETLDISHKQFVQLWLKLHPDNTYLCHCFNNVGHISDLSDVILLEIFKFWDEKPEWLKEYRILVKIMGIKPNYQFFKQLDAIPVFENRIDFIIGTSREEQIYLLRMVGKWMRTDRHQVLSSLKLKETYPELFAYLDDGKMPFDDEIKFYMSKYKAYKLENSLPDDETTYFNQIQTDIYDMRYSILSEYLDSDTIVLWIDALGIEWFPLLHWSLSKHCDAEIKAEAIGQACLPTETMFNNQWEKMNYPYEKLDKLDKLAHKGVIDEPDYYTCVQEQLTFVAGICHKVTELMREHRRIIITGDHGTSRLAARFFHNRDAMPLPKNAKACSHGRYCLLGEGSFLSVQNTQVVTANGNKYAVFQNYDHFTQSGFAAGADDMNAIYGEVHGGATPEEMLVPIIVLDSNQAIPLTGEWLDKTVKISMNKVKLQIRFNLPVNHLQVKIAGIDGETIQTPDAKKWNITFKKLGKGTYPVQVYADGKILELPDVTINPPLGGGEGDLP